jgi:hypothetical protein
MVHEDKLCISKDCKKCDMGYILKNYTDVIIQMLTTDIPEYNMENLTTKCLNTAVMLMYFMMGRRGINVADACDCAAFRTSSTEAIMKGYMEQNKDTVARLKASVMSRRDKKRQLYYVLLTDANLKSSEVADAYFPGHVFIIEKVPNGKQLYYNIYQSYRNEYDLDGYFRKSDDTFHVPHAKMVNVMDALEYIMTGSVWDAKCVHYWKMLTHVDSTKYLNMKYDQEIFICFRKVAAQYCAENLEKYVVEKLKHLESQGGGGAENNIIFNKKECIRLLRKLLQDIRHSKPTKLS